MTELPQALRPLAAYNQWMVYLAVPKSDGKTDKFPADFRTGQVVSAHDAQFWTTSDQAIASAAHFGSQYGVAFVFTEQDPFFFIDIDGAWDGTQWNPIAQQVCQLFAGAGIEVSRSHTGLHIFGTYTPGSMPRHACRNGELGLEFYHTKRFVALTGINATGDAGRNFDAVLQAFVATYMPPRADDGLEAGEWSDGPVNHWRGPADDTVLIERAMRSQSANSTFGNRARFAELWNRVEPVLLVAFPDGTGGIDESRVDAALAQHLAFWTGNDCERMERLMQQSKLARDKWERADGQFGTYLRRTIATAVGMQSEVLQDKPVELPTVAQAVSEQAATPSLRAKTGATFANIEAQHRIFAGCVYVQDEHKIFTPQGDLLKPEQFKVRYGGYTFQMDLVNQKVTRDAWEAVTQSQAFSVPQVATTTFEPSLPMGSVVNNAVNTYKPVVVARSTGDVSRFMQHLRLLMPDERDQEILLSYLCACVQHQGVKFQWAPLIQGAEGNGKTLFSRCAAQAVGAEYTHWPRADKLANGFNSWIRNRILICVEDIYIPGNRRDVLNILKPMITSDEVEIEAKGRDQVTARVCANFIFNSNHKDAIPVTVDSRRYAIFYTAQQTAADVLRDGMIGEYFPSLYQWLRGGGYAAVNELLHTRPICPEFNPAGACGRAPMTSTSALAVKNSRGILEQSIEEWIVQGYDGFRGNFVSSLMLERKMFDTGMRKISRGRMDEVMETLSYCKHEGLPEGRAEGVVMPDGGRPILYVLKHSPQANLRDPNAIQQAYQKTNAMWSSNTPV